MCKKLYLLFIVVVGVNVYSQKLTQNVRGTVIDAINEMPIVGANVILLNQVEPVGTITNADGQFKLENVPLGRQNIEVRFIGYKPAMRNNLLVISGKELVVNIRLEEEYQKVGEVTVKANARKRPQNEMAMISSRTFSVEETERFAGSLGDPARMVANYAGVMTQNDSRNDIIIRGNSPIGVQWRLEGIDIPNPNHFAAQGTTGGPVSMLNNNLLSNSDFLTGAFPAEYGNATAGAFDLYMRSGNNNRAEYTGQIGFNGFELGVEGPFGKKEKSNRPSYLANFRYSTLEVMDKLGFSVGTGAAVPHYKDFAFIMDIPATKYGRFKIIGLWGDSYIELGHNDEEGDDNAYTAKGTTTNYGSDLAVGGLTHSLFFNEKIGVKSVVSLQRTVSKAEVDSLKNNGSFIMPFYRGNQQETKLTASSRLIYKPNSNNNISFGVTYDHFFVNYQDSVFEYDYNKFIDLSSIDANLGLMRGFAQWQHLFSARFTGYAGLYSQYFKQSDEWVAEPRLSLRYALPYKQSITAGFGMHSQLQPRILYFFESYHADDNSYRRTNENVGFTRANHYVLAYDKQLGNDFRLKVETYYQDLFKVPVKESFPEFSMINAGDFFSIPNEDSLINEGTGFNYGVEFTLEKFLSQGYYFLLTASLFDSKYKGYDGIERNTAFNGNYVVNALGGYEFTVGKSDMITFDVKTVWAGGRRYVPIDIEASRAAHSAEYDWSNAYKKRYNDYFRADFRIGYKMNRKSFSQEWAIDLQNVTNYKSLFLEGYDVDKGEIYEIYQQGFLPMFLYRIQF
jgi:hypothetical protein